MEYVMCNCYAGAANWVSLGNNWPLRLGDDKSSPVGCVLPVIGWSMNKPATYCPLAQQRNTLRRKPAANHNNQGTQQSISMLSMHSPARGPRWRRHGHAIGIQALKEPV